MKPAPKLGRPKKKAQHRHDHIIKVCLTERERKMVDRAAAQAGKDRSTWVREKVLDGLEQGDVLDRK